MNGRRHVLTEKRGVMVCNAVFYGKSSLNVDLSAWDVSKVTSMASSA
eukprot:COSAG01_NODE_4320_length_5136_cov_11.367282_2_plen_47_part_00